MMINVSGRSLGLRTWINKCPGLVRNAFEESRIRYSGRLVGKPEIGQKRSSRRSPLGALLHLTWFGRCPRSRLLDRVAKSPPGGRYFRFARYPPGGNVQRLHRVNAASPRLTSSVPRANLLAR